MADRWVTYEEAGETFGLSADAMRKRARRLGWRVTSGNDGKARVLIPDGAVIGPDGRSGRPAGRPDGRADDLLAELRRRAEGAEAERDSFAAEIIRERERRARAEGERDTERQARIAAEAREAEAVALTRQVVGQLDAAHRERAEAVSGKAAAEVAFEQALGRAQRAEGEATALRGAATGAAAQAAADRAARQVAEAAAEAARGELAATEAGSPLSRAWRALIYRRGRP